MRYLSDHERTVGAYLFQLRDSEENVVYYVGINTAKDSCQF